MFLLLSILISLGISICGQTKTGTIRGVLTDSQGAVMPRQKIVIKTANAEEDDKARYAVTDFSGAFEFSTLPIGKYLLEFTMPGFEGGFRKQVSLTVEHPSAADVVFVMEPCGDIEASAVELLELALDRDAPDNVSLIIVRATDAPAHARTILHHGLQWQ